MSESEPDELAGYARPLFAAAVATGIAATGGFLSGSTEMIGELSGTGTGILLGAGALLFLGMSLVDLVSR